MRLACCAYSYRDCLQGGKMTLEEFIATCAEMGLDGVELTSYYFPATDRAYLNEIKKCCFAQGLHISGTAVGNNFCQPDPAKRREQVDLAKTWMDHAVVLGAPCIRVFAGPVPQGHTEPEAFDWTVACLKECAAYGEKLGVVVALENHGGITATAEQALKLVKAVSSPWLGVNLDFGNYSKDPYHEFVMTAPYTVTTHAKTHYQGPTGMVEVDYHKAADIMRQVSYKGYISIEYESEAPAAEAVPRFVEYLKKAVR
ncbi:MAG: sugar phosphate isomerase/epimerase [Armatimonadetes bacterium]|nr:sugar phosphate isomerase/epimerase [Armatimonadota bacterium]